jgi:outer membrane protein TolC
MAAANAQIGVAAAAYYPSITISPVAGFETRSLTSLFEASSLLWSLGATVTQPLLSGGRLSANVDIAKANYDATVASYRRVVLTAMQEVEDGITGLAALERADRQARTAVETARKVLDLANARYEGGATTYLDVITAQQSLLSAERLAAQLGGQAC